MLYISFVLERSSYEIFNIFKWENPLSIPNIKQQPAFQINRWYLSYQSFHNSQKGNFKVHLMLYMTC